MAQFVLEIVNLPIPATTDLESGPAAERWQEALTIGAGTPGCLAIFWGRQIENPNVVDVVIRWDEVASHHAFVASERFASFVEIEKTLITGPPRVASALIDSEFAPFVEYGVTEVLTMYLKPSHHPGFAGVWNEFATKLTKADTKVVALAATGGWLVDDVKHKALGENDEEGSGKGFFAAIGWNSVDEHMAFRDTQAFADAIPLMRTNASAVDMHHTKFRKFEKKA